MQCDCEFRYCERIHDAAHCQGRPEMKAEIMGHTLNLCFDCFIRQTVSLAGNEYRIIANL